LQASVDFGGSDQTVSATITTKRDKLPAVVELVGKLLRQPAFAAGPMNELRQQWLASIERQRKDPEALIANKLARHGNPYPRGDLRHATTFDEQEADVKAVTLEQIQAFHRRLYSAHQGQFTAVGDMDVAAVKKALDAALGDWAAPAAGPQLFVRVPQPLVPVPPARFVEVTPDKANAHLRGQLSLPISDRHPDYPALALANHIFGYGASSWLMQRIREKEGLSYDVRSVMSWSAIDENTTWDVSAIFAPQNQPKVEAAFKDELARSLTAGFSATDVADAQKSLLNFRRLSRAQDAAVAGQLVNNLYLSRRFALSQAVDDALAKLTPAEVNAAWRKYIVPDKLVLAWGGDFKQP
jgi:zinc protease